MICIALLWIATSCEESVNIDLRDADRTLVIDGLVTNTMGPHRVQLTWLLPFGDTASNPAAEEAIVRITDDLGNSETLEEAEPGMYKTQNLPGEIGRTYTLHVEIEGQTYEATSKLPPVGRLDSVVYQYEEDLALVPEAAYYLFFYAQDNGATRDFYMTELLQNDTLYLDGTFPYLLFDDRFGQGSYINGFLVPFPLDSGATAQLVFYTLNQPAYEYFFTLSAQDNSGSPFGSPPANPPTNISNGGLGYFRAAGYASLKGDLVGNNGVFK